MKILITGANGQLGRDCHHLLAQHHDTSCCDVPLIDITDEHQVAKIFTDCTPEVVINCAAYTAVDACEHDRQRCLEVNARGPEILARQCAEHGSRLVQISTDYIFDGLRPAPHPYLEDDPPHPLSVYGESKLAGEQAAQSVDNHLIIRTAWLYGIGNKNFLKTMLRLALIDPSRTIRVVNDQHGSLTWSWRLARQIETLLDSDLTGIVHASAAGHSTWYQGARFFLDAMKVPYSMIPCTTAEYPTPARRPANSILENSRLKAAGLDVMADWQEDILTFVDRYRDQLLREAEE
ncbi:dTDP-4-dehydrorhamnose reductase [Desulfobulbus alkaliphilus]|uniref:dTDP-4-dehydrorhamnose reductase n=1 Tax=Desulfobulbus alkaliphilus TaxID=869814 RepID=UPI0019650785|nr:dTDP-4-dehydrorhamnose reductase [Desulfobulbus alkaliphilus]MBM9538116.1 dTDP-4-dehydrorhamnose reductase [Desulfobulbus alkaliphilus]